MLETMLTLATALLRVQTDLSEVRSMLQRSTVTHTETATSAQKLSRWLQYASLLRSTWGMLAWAFGTRWGQTLVGFLMPLLMSEIKWGWLIALVKRLLGFGG